MEIKDKQPGIDATPPAPAVQHAEPQAGGSYIRDLATGAISKVGAEPADQRNQE